MCFHDGDEQFRENRTCGGMRSTVAAIDVLVNICHKFLSYLTSRLPFCL